MSNRKSTPDILGKILATPPADAANRAQTAGTVEHQHIPFADVAVQPSPGPASPAVAKRPEWEYMTVTLEECRGLRPRMINDTELENWKSQPLMRDFLSIVGGYGWELAAVVALRRNQKEAYFKRPKTT